MVLGPVRVRAWHVIKPVHINRQPLPLALGVILPCVRFLNHTEVKGVFNEGNMLINKIQRVNENISILPLNLQDHLILVDDQIVGMYHEGHETARILRNANYQVAVLHLEREGFEIQYTNEPFILSQWTNDGGKTCGEIIFDSKQ